MILQKLRSLFLYAVCAAVPFTMARAQEQFEMKIFRPQIGVTVLTTPVRNFGDVSGTYRMRSWRVNASIPVQGDIEQSQGGVAVSQLQIQSAVRISSPEISILQSQHQLYTGMLGLTGIYITEAKNLYLLSASMALSEDEITIESPSPNAHILGIGTYHTGQNFFWLFGVSLSSYYGKENILPLAGFRWYPSLRWSLDCILPFTMNVRYRPTKDIRLGYSLTISGDRISFDNNGEFAGEPEDLFLRLFQIKSGAEIVLDLSQNFRVNVEAGVLGGRHLWFSTDNTNILSTSIASSGYLVLGISTYVRGTTFDWFE